MKHAVFSTIQKALGTFGYALVNQRVRHPADRNPMRRDHFFDLYFDRVDPAEFFFVQVGANDGKSGDPIFQHVIEKGLRGIMLEPQPDVFERLKHNYRNHPNVTLVNAAVSATAGQATLYTVRDSFKNEENFFLVTGIASFNREVFIKTLRNKLPKGAPIEDYVCETKVECVDFGTLFARHHVTKVDLLQVDCEGYDYEIIKMFGIPGFLPSLVNYESIHLSEDDRLACERVWTANGYSFFSYRGDTCAYRTSGKSAASHP